MLASSLRNKLDLIKGIVFGLIFIVAFVLFIPLLIIASPFLYASHRRSEKKLRNYLSELGHKNFFCYNNRADVKDFIEKELKLRLHSDIEFIYLDGRNLIPGTPNNTFSPTLYNLKNYRRFPHLVKIRDGKVNDENCLTRLMIFLN